MKNNSNMQHLALVLHSIVSDELEIVYFLNIWLFYDRETTGAYPKIRMSCKSSFISVIQLKLWNSCIK